MEYPIPPRPSVPPRARLADLRERFGGDLYTPGDPDPHVSGVSLDSRRVEPGDLYAALPGSAFHGADFVDSAIATGAAAVLTDAAGAGRITVKLPVWVVPHPRAVLGRVAAAVYGQPGDRLRSIGVTGTHGKTTTCFMLEAGLVGGGATAGLVGTIGTRIAGWSVKTTLTTPEAPDLHALFAVMVEHDVDAVAMEVSSHALVMGRVDGVVFDVAVFTNLGRDHLDFHADLEDYFRAKAQLFTTERARRGLVNVDDLFGRRLLEQAAPDGIPMRSYSPSGAEADWRVEDVESRPDGSDLVIVAPDEARYPLRLTAPGQFNVANALAAVAALGEAGLDIAGAVSGVSKVTGIPGRMESVRSALGFTVVVDYAHKPDAVTAVLSALRPVTPERLIAVIGAGGDRDRGKRPIMGEIAARLSDLLVITDDNPRTEDAATIRSEVIEGADDVLAVERAEVLEIGDRQAAIATALSRARPGDCVLVAGKGHELGQEVAGVVHPFDDRDVVRTVLDRLAAEANA